jgi:tetratricopeptide (TPR) repeat protein
MDWLKRFKSVLQPKTAPRTADRWTGSLRHFIATGEEELHRAACRDCADERLRAVLVALESASSESLVEAERQAKALLEAGRREESGALRLFMALPAATAIAASGAIARDPDRLEGICAAAARWAEDLGFHECQAHFEHALGCYARTGGNSSAAKNHLSSALSIFRRLGQTQPGLYALPLARALHVWGKVHRDQGDRKTEAVAFAEALALCEEHGRDGERNVGFHGGLLLDNGNLRDALGDKAGARQQYEQALTICDALSSEHGELVTPVLAGALHNLAQLEIDLGRPEQARPLFERSLALWERLEAQDPVSFGPHAARARSWRSALVPPAPRAPTEPAASNEPDPCSNGRAPSGCRAQATPNAPRTTAAAPVHADHMAATTCPEGTLRRDPSDRRKMQRLRGGVWLSARAWLVSGSDPGIRDFHVTSGGEEPPPGSQAVEDPIGLMEALTAGTDARRALEAARLGEPARFLLDVICLLEPEDRWRWFVEPTLPVIRSGVGLPSDTTLFDATLGELTGAGLVKSVVVGSDIGPIERHHVEAPLVSVVTAAIQPERQHRMRRVVIETWKGRFLDEEAAPTGTTVRAGIATAVYLKR